MSAVGDARKRLKDTARTPIYDRVPTEAEITMFREEAGLGVCSDPRGEFGRDYRILALLKALDDARASARTAWDVHAEHVDTMNVLIARHAGDATFERIRAEKAEEQLAKITRTDLPAPPPTEPSTPWCRDCGPGYRLGDEGCRHGEQYQPAEGETGVCRTCAQPIWWETGKVGGAEVLGWSDRIERGGDSVVCFRAVSYRHVPMGGREAAIYRAGFKAGTEAREEER